MRGIPSQCRPGPCLSGPSSAGFYAVFPAPSQQGASLPSFKSFHQTHFSWWPSFPGTGDAYTCPGCFAWHPARGWHSTSMISLSPPLNTRQQGGGSARAGVTARIQRVDPLPPFLAILAPAHAGPWHPCKPLCPAPRQTSVSQTEGLIPSCQSAWKKESRLPGGRGMATVTLGGPS